MNECAVVIRGKERNLRTLLRNPELYVTIVDSSCTPMCMSPSFCDLLGYSRDAIRELRRRGGSIINHFVCPDRREDEWAMFQLMVAGYQQNAVFNSRLMTRGGAEVLGLDETTGDLTPGKEADFVVLDFEGSAITARRTAAATSIEEKLFALMTLGDDRNIAATYILGRKV